MAISSREYALVYRAGLSNEVRPFKLSFWDKSYNLAHGTLQIQNFGGTRGFRSFKLEDPHPSQEGICREMGTHEKNAFTR
jgi:hypothetical protein